MKRKIRVIAATMALAIAMNICMPVYALAMPSSESEEAPQSPNSITNSEVDQDLQTIAGEPIEVQEDISEDNVESTTVPESVPEATETPVPAASEEQVPVVESTPGVEPAPTVEPTPAAVSEPSATPEPEMVSTAETAAPANGGLTAQATVIEVTSYEQLVKIGSGETVDGQVYTADGTYTIAQDIELPQGVVWTLPENFTGRIEPRQTDGDRPLYEAATDTIYVYHAFQLAVMDQDNAAQEPVLDGDAQAETFGMGQLIYPNGEDQPYLTYGPEHRYVISTQFSSDLPVETYANKSNTMPVPGSDGTTRLYDGRDFPGQVIKTIDGVDYILIGNADQLRAIGTDAKVYTAAYELKWVKDDLIGLVGHYEISTDDNGNPVMVYGGDADLLQEQNGTSNYEFQDVDDSILEDSYGGVDQTTGEITAVDESWKTEYSYSSDANYIIFRDIDLENINWTPLMFSGTMVGAKANDPADQSTLWTNPSPDDFSSATGFAEGVQRPEIQNVNVVQNDAINPENTKGVGFFATLSRPSEIGQNSIGTSGQVIVKNLALKNVYVENNTNELDVDVKLLGGTLAALGLVIGPLLDTVLKILTLGQVNFNTTEMLNDLLNVYATDKTVLATGAFAGRIEGNVQIEDCTVSTATVTSVNGLTGGFVGYTTGVTQYSILGSIAGTLVQVLEKIVGVIPGLGLDDLVEVLLENALPLNALIPTGYESPKLTNCMVTGLSGTVGKNTTEFNGGFAGQIIGAQLTSCHVQDGTYTVQAANYGGGFVGLARDAEIKGMLQDGLGILDAGTTGSLLLQCSVENWTPAVTDGQAAVQGGSYLGGFAGALANSYTVDCDLTMAGTELSVNGTGNYVGGWAGIGSVGWAMELGKNNTNDTTLLGGVTDLLSSLLSSGGDTTALLSIAGVSPSAIMGCQITGRAGVKVHADGNYAGGFVGGGSGLLLTPATSDYLNKLTYWKSETITQAPSERSNTLTGLSQVTASGDYAGGIAGSLGGASVGGLLNGTVGLGEFLGFTVDSVSMDGPYLVQAKEYAGGAVGIAMGGVIQNVTLSEVQSVTAENFAGGFIGAGGPGSLASTDSLSLNLLGLNNLLEVENLLNVIPGVKLELENCTVSGAESNGYTVQATGSDLSVEEYVAGGFIGRSNSTSMANCRVTGLNFVTAADTNGFAGGFVGISSTGELAELGDLKDSDGAVIAINDLLGTIGIMVPDYTNCTVSYADGGYVQADVAGGFVGKMQSGKVNNQNRGEGDYYAVYNIDNVSGQTYAGGFGGKVYSGALADVSGGISILGGSGLSINVNELLSIVEAYVPYVQYAGVKSDNGFTVTADQMISPYDSTGSAGGFIGYASGAQISYCDVTSLKHTDVVPPDDLETVDAPSYFDKSQSSYAVKGEQYAGGFVGYVDIGSAASVGGGLGVLGNSIQLNDILSVLSVVVTTIEHSDVTGAAGGYSVSADNGRSSAEDGDGGPSSGIVGEGPAGRAGGFAGVIYGGHIQDSNAHNFEYVIGRISAGGYVGEMKHGDVTSVLEDASILSSLVSVDTALASLLQTFVPTIRNSSTDAVPCGGVVRAQEPSDPGTQRGMAGGYVGYNQGGQILGLNTDPWLSAEPYTGTTSLCKAERIRSVYGREYAGGFTGFMEAADTAGMGGLSILGGLISVDNILGALSIVYPIQENTAVYGPLANLDVETWNSWAEYVGQYGGYGFELAQSGKVNDQDELNAKLADYIYGFNVVAGRNEKGDNNLANPGGDAGGYVGLMRSGTLTNCMAYDAALVRGRHSAGGFAGRMETDGAADFGSVSILDLKLDIGKLINVAEVFVPAVRNCSVQGYRSGLTVEATGTPAAGDDVGYAGGFVGAAYGAQIQLNDNDLPNTEEEGSVVWESTDKYPAPVASCDVRNLRRVTGRNAIGGYVGIASSASLASVDTNASDGILQKILDSLLSNAGDLVQLLPATYTTIHKASVSPADADWGFVVDGTYQEDDTVKYAPYAGGFAGFVQAATIGEKADTGTTEEQQTETTYSVTVNGLRSVQGGLYAGGFFGMADVAGVAEVGGTDAEGSTVDVIGPLLKLGSVDALDVLRCYINNVAVNGVDEGFAVRAYSTNAGEGLYEETRQTGCAGGFGGGLMNGTVQNGIVTNLSSVEALNYTGGFIGHMGKSGAVDVDSVDLLNKFLSANAGVIDLFGSQVFDSSVTGIAAGAVVKATSGSEPIAGGFVGYSDLGRIKNSNVNSLKKVTSDQIAGGFIGKTDMAYLVSVGADSPLLNGVLYIVNELVKNLYLDSEHLQSINLGHINLGVASVDVLWEGNVAKVNLLGIQISVALSKKADDNNQQTDVAIITIGDSEIRLPCTNDGVNQDDLKNAEINLIKGNRTELDNCTVTGVTNGYDVFGGGATQEVNGSHENGMTGGFVGYNHEGKISNSQMVLCDVVRGTAQRVGPFTGYNDLKSVYWFNTIASIEGDGNTYSIYRPADTTLKTIQTADGKTLGDVTAQPETVDGTAYNRYVIDHITDFENVLDTGKDLTVYDMFLALKDAKETGTNAENQTVQRELNAYVSDAKVVLMLDTDSPDNQPTIVPEPGVVGDPCSENVDLTVQKIWDDWFNFGQTRPDSITLTVYQQAFTLQDEETVGEGVTTYPSTEEGKVWAPELNASGAIVDPVSFKELTLTEADQESPWSAVWSDVLEDVPIFAFTDVNGNETWDEGETRTYYVYTVEEVDVPDGYTVHYDLYNPTDADDYELTVTNKLNIPLPDTGAGGDILFVVVGVGILLLAVTVRKRRLGEKGQ